MEKSTNISQEKPAATPVMRQLAREINLQEIKQVAGGLKPTGVIVTGGTAGAIGVDIALEKEK